MQAPDRKIKYGAATTVVVYIVSFLLVHYLLHRQLTPTEAGLLPGVVSATIGWVVAYYTKHEKPRLDPPKKA